MTARDWIWFVAWAVVGAAAALGAISLGWLVLVPVLIVAGVMFRRRGLRRSSFGFLSGAGALFLYIAWLHRDGPRTTCWRTASASGCDEHLNPLPWLILGVVLLLGGIVGHAARNR